jgi:hypothetical protein
MQSKHASSYDLIISLVWYKKQRRLCKYGTCVRKHASTCTSSFFFKWQEHYYVHILCTFTQDKNLNYITLMWYSVTIQYKTIQNKTILHKTMQYNIILYKTRQDKTRQCNVTIQYDTIQYNTINTIQYNTIQYNTIQYNTIHTINTIQYNKYNTIQCNTSVVMHALKRSQQLSAILVLAPNSVEYATRC